MTTDNLARLICTCATPIVDYNQQLSALSAADNMGALSQKMAEGDQIMHTAHECVTSKIMTSVRPFLTDELSIIIDRQCHLDSRMVDDILRKISEFDQVTFKSE